MITKGENGRMVARMTDLWVSGDFTVELHFEAKAKVHDGDWYIAVEGQATYFGAWQKTFVYNIEPWDGVVTILTRRHIDVEKFHAPKWRQWIKNSHGDPRIHIMSYAVGNVIAIGIDWRTLEGYRVTSEPRLEKLDAYTLVGIAKSLEAAKPEPVASERRSERTAQGVASMICMTMIGVGITTLCICYALRLLGLN